MRPLRLVCTVSFLFLVVFFIILSLLQPNLDPNDGTNRQQRKDYRSRWSFGAPASLFPPSAIISLTDDNTTFFLARPALYGPLLPSDGLSGQLWVGLGFGDDTLLRGGMITVGQAELGCSDIPGWSEERIQFPTSPSAPGSRPEIDSKMKSEESTTQQQAIPAEDDDTDNFLHYPLRSGPIQDVAESKSAHADIQSIQEGAAIAGKVVLLSRGGCGFLEKTKWVQRRGGVALIVGDYTRGGHLIQMSSHDDTSNITIPSIFTAYTSAHLLSSLVPSRSEMKDSRKQQKIVVDKPAFTKTTALPKPTKASAMPVVKTAPNQSMNTKPEKIRLGWFSYIATKIGLIKRGPDAKANRRPPSSGTVSWVQSQDWDDDVSSKGTKSDPIKIAPEKSNDLPGKHIKDEDFVIGVHDWRDPHVGSRSKDSKGVNREQGGAENTNAGSQNQNHNSKEAAPAEDKTAATDTSPQDESWLHSLLNPGKTDDTIAKDAQQAQDMYKSKIAPHFVQDQEFQDVKHKDTPEHEGLWITITPTSVSANPFFDTLLVLVISPLVTLSIVYALLLVRSRIRRRRWRAPRSVVDRLPVRTYHTLSSFSSSTSSSQHTSPQHSSPTTPLLPSTVSRSRPRSATIASIRQEASASLERATAHLSSREKPVINNAFKRKYKGRQVECVVCLEEYIDGQSQVMSLPCGHEFHADCITPWLTTRRRTCPICKGDVVRSMDGTTGANTPASSGTANSSYTSLVLLNETNVATSIRPQQNSTTTTTPSALQQQTSSSAQRPDPITRASDRVLQDNIASSRNDNPSSAIPIPTLSSTAAAKNGNGQSEDLAATLVGSRQSADGILTPPGTPGRGGQR